MMKPNWENFRVKFSENPQNNFEWFCYLLFCKEFNKLYGIFRYKNQSAIETNPIEVGNEVIGWQAKFYDTPLSQHKDNLLSTIEKSKRDHPNLTKLFVYTNQEWGQDKGKDPQGLIKIEQQAKELNLVIEWRTASFFESEFVSINSEYISKHFFSLNKSIFQLIKEQQWHTENILSKISNCIDWRSGTVEIDRTQHIKKLKDQLKDPSKQVLILSGMGGVGKTVIIKKLYEELKDEIPFFVFKATEFELRNINDLFVGVSFYDFVQAYENEKNKIIVIDSSEKLVDLKNSDPFKEFLSVLHKDKWNIIFTTRDNYLEDLNYQFFEIYNIAPLNISIKNLELKELSNISEKHLFLLPKDEKLLELIRNPFYLNEYLKFYNDSEKLEYSDFKTKLWNRNIKKSKPEREIQFLKIAFERANTGQFFISPRDPSNILDNELVKDGILGYESPGYFITHDIYEEWALEKIIANEFIKKTEIEDFFDQIRESLPIRRCFRNWLSEQLLLENDDIKEFIEEVIENQAVKQFWKDEIFVSVLLSNYAEKFFEIFEYELLANNQNLLKEITFRLRIACKQIDYDFYEELGIKEINLFSLKVILTKPKGQGWRSLIKFIFDKIDAISIDKINFTLPVIYDWNSQIKTGETTRYASLIALKYYQYVLSKDIDLDRDAENHLLNTIFNGASEIKDELKDIFEQIIQNQWKNYGDPYYNFSKFILTKIEAISISEILPEYILKLADLFWTYTVKINDSVDQSDQPRRKTSASKDIKIEYAFGLTSNDSDYFPASAFQTPIYWLLKSSLKKTIDFILSFTNKSVHHYARSGYNQSVDEIKVFLEHGDNNKQFISDCLWNMYRGTGSPVSPYLLQSIHMALEKYFLEFGKNAESKTLEYWLVYVLKNSNSASISSVVTSTVLAYPEKTFNVAKILFKTKEFIIYDRIRLLVLEQSAKTLYSIGYDLSEKDKVYHDERRKTCNDPHRKWSLEDLFLKYQCFRSDKITQKEAENRKQVLWQILDDYYQDLPAESKLTEFDKTWSLCLARMDKRKMNITTKPTDDGLVIQFNPEIDPKLKEYSDRSLSKSLKNIKYISLKLWAECKFNNDEKYKDYAQYENEPLLALKEVKDIIKKIEAVKGYENKAQHPEDENFILFYDSIPAYVCSILIENNLDVLSREDKIFCKDILLCFAFSSLIPTYQYQRGNGVQPAVYSLPNLLKVFPEEKQNIKLIILLNIFNDYHVPNMFYRDNLWESNFHDAQSLLFGYLLLKPKYDDVYQTFIRQNNRLSIYEENRENFIDYFIEKNQVYIQKICENKLVFSDLTNIETYDLRLLNIAFKIIPKNTFNLDHKTIIKIIISTFAEKLFLEDNGEKIDYETKHDFLKNYAYFVLNLKRSEMLSYLKPFLDNFKASECVADLFNELILAEDSLKTDDNFWFIWDSFKEKVFDICKNENAYIFLIIKSYLFAGIPWNKEAKEWQSLTNKNKKFFKDVSKKLGHCQSTLYSIAKMLNGIGSLYMDDGVTWIAEILKNNQNHVNKKNQINSTTIDYIENFLREFIFGNRENLKKNTKIKNQIIIILNFLVENGSAIGYMLRETII